MPEENEWEVCKRKREKILKSIQFCGLFVVLQQRQKPTQGSQTELQLLSFTFPFFPNSPAPHRTVHFVYSMCVSFFLFLYSFSACILFFQFRQYFLVFFSYLFFFSFFTWSPALALHVSCCRLAPMRGESSLSQHWLPSTCSIHLSLFTHPLCVDCINLAHVVIAAIDA